MLREKLLGEKIETVEAAQVPARPPILCPGCPHRSVFSVLSELKIHAAGDIGCYTLGAVAPLSVIDTTVCMGSSISTLHGMEKAKGKDYIKNWVAVIYFKLIEVRYDSRFSLSVEIPKELWKCRVPHLIIQPVVFYYSII